MLPPLIYEVGEDAGENKQKDPTRGTHFPSDIFHLFLPRDAQQPGLGFSKDQFPTLVAIDAGVANNKEEISLFEDSCRSLRHLVSATGASQVAPLPLAERARGVRAAGHLEEMQAILPFLGEPVIGPHSFQQTLPSQIRQIGPSGAWRVGKMLHHVARVHTPLLVNQQEGLMLIRLHSIRKPGGCSRLKSGGALGRLRWIHS